MEWSMKTGARHGIIGERLQQKKTSLLFSKDKQKKKNSLQTQFTFGFSLSFRNPRLLFRRLKKSADNQYEQEKKNQFGLCYRLSRKLWQITCERFLWGYLLLSRSPTKSMQINAPTALVWPPLYICTIVWNTFCCALKCQLWFQPLSKCVYSLIILRKVSFLASGVLW